MLLVLPLNLRRACGVEGTFGLAAAVADAILGRTFLVALARDLLACFAETDEFAHPLHPNRTTGLVARVRLGLCFGVKYALTVARDDFTVDPGMQFQASAVELQSKL